MSKVWKTDTAADEAELQQKLSDLRRAKRDFEEVIWDGSKYTITYLDEE
jgi:DNA-binding winged helix-turn-helix (wHTH) protein